MKFDYIFNQEAINMTQNMVLVDMNRLHETGINNAIQFMTGDVLEIPDTEHIQIYHTSFINKKKEEMEYDVIKVGFNGKVRVIPVASFRRDRNGIDEFRDTYATKSAICRDLRLANDDYARITAIAGKKLKVREMFDAREKRFGEDDRIIPYNKDDIKTFNTKRWPIFDEIE